MNLNFFPIRFDFNEYQINTEPYSDERIKELRQMYNTTHSFFRNEDKIFISNNQEMDNITLGNTETINVYEDSKITSQLIKHVFFRDFKNRFPRYIPTDFYPFRFFSGKDDLLSNILPQDLKGKIAFRKLIEVQLRKIEYNNSPLFGYIINIDRNWTFSKSCEELNNEGFSLNQVEVVHTETFPGLENIIAPNEEFIGVIKEIKENSAVVLTNNGEETYSLKELYIRKTRPNIGNYLNFKIGSTQSTKIFDEIKKKTPEIYKAQNLYREIGTIAHPLVFDKEQADLFQNT